MPCVMRKATVRERPRPNHPVFSSHSLRRHINERGVFLFVVGPGTMIRAITKMTTPGKMIDRNASSHVGIVSCSLYGKDIERSVRENGR